MKCVCTSTSPGTPSRPQNPRTSTASVIRPLEPASPPHTAPCNGPIPRSASEQPVLDSRLLLELPYGNGDSIAVLGRGGRSDRDQLPPCHQPGVEHDHRTLGRQMQIGPGG